MEKRYACPVCSFYTLYRKAGRIHEVCPVCFWEDDPLHLSDPDYRQSCNELSLTEARENYRLCGADRPADLPYIRPPFPQELPENQKASNQKLHRMIWMTISAIIGIIAFWVGNLPFFILMTLTIGLQLFRFWKERNEKP
jgi:hypothetical protein